jgi:hypothetical protein
LAGRNLTADCVVQIGTVPFLLRIEEEAFANAGEDYRLCSWVFAVRGSARGWAALWQDPPPPGWHDIFALTKRARWPWRETCTPRGNLQYFKDVVTLPRKGGPR